MTEPTVPPSRRMRRNLQRVTMTDVAAAADVSPSTVSLFLRRPGAVSDRIGARVSAAIEELGYVPNAMAGGLAAAGSRVVSVIVPSLRNAFFSETLSALEGLLAHAGLQVLVGHTEYSLAQEEALVRAALSWAPAAVVLTGQRHTDTTRALLRKAATPVVEMWELGGVPIDQAVGFSHAAVGHRIAQRFVERGYASAAFLGARLADDSRAGQRAAGFLAGMEAAARPARLLEDPDPASTGVGARLLARMLDAPVRAVACSNDTLALGVLFEAQRRGLAVPGDLAVAGFGDLDFAAQTVPPLTTIRPSADRIAAQVAACILARNTDPEASTSHDTGFTFMARESA